MKTLCIEHYMLQVSYEGYFSLASELVRLWDVVEQKMEDREKHKM